MRRVSNINTSNVHELIPVASSPVPQLPSQVSFAPDIKDMLYGLGDCHSPLDSTSVLIEEIVLTQMLKIIGSAEESAKHRGKHVQPEDILFLMRRNKPALKRLITYLGVMDRKGSLEKIAKSPGNLMTSNFSFPSLELPDASKLIVDESHSVESLIWEKGRMLYCLKFLSKLGITPASLDSLTDHVKQRRNERADARALISSRAAYEMYHASRCATFCKADFQFTKFTRWLETRGDFKGKLDGSVLEILVYLAKETVACLVDMVLTLREEDVLRKDAVSTQAISPEEIREAIRRFRFQFYLKYNAMSRDVPPIGSSPVFIAF